MKTINSVIRRIAVRHGLPGSVALREASVSGGADHPGTRSRHIRWLAVLTLAIALVQPASSAPGDDTITISGVFSMDTESGMYDISPELYTVYINGHEHTWRLTLHGTTQSHHSNGSYFGTDIHATSFELEFFGPDAATLNAVVNDRLAGLAASAYLQNTHLETGGGLAIMHVWVGQAWGGNLYFYSGHDIGVNTLFPADADGYPVVGPEPFSINPDYTELAVSELFSGWYGGMGSLAGPVTFEVAQETGTVAVTGTFYTDSGEEHTWSLALHGTTHSHSEGWSSYYTQYRYSYYTDVQATSFDLQFSGPDADDLNQAASEQFAGGKARLQLRNTSRTGFDLSTMVLWVSSPDGSATFRAGNYGSFTSGFFPPDADGYPTVTPEPFMFWSELTAISWYGEFYDEWLDTYPYPNAEISGSLGPEVPPPLPQLSVKLSNNVLTVSWQSPSIGFVLQQNDQLNTSNWVTPTETVTDNGVIRFITVNDPTGSRFFRLFKP